MKLSLHAVLLSATWCWLCAPANASESTLTLTGTLQVSSCALSNTSAPGDLAASLHADGEAQTLLISGCDQANGALSFDGDMDAEHPDWFASTDPDVAVELLNDGNPVKAKQLLTFSESQPLQLTVRLRHSKTRDLLTIVKKSEPLSATLWFH